ncbi:phenylalanyl-tRNA synthetase alpha subunit [Metamycoplasma subdolum]|uniref:phenylalanine--tRNA ligase n=1 Tax=Metamycoplasma subdolum TaxID=92407 RepID=A0A3M0A4R0_9BACT|nr:phenylalanine--tRNA ligase subunit alpha [Metamycoplasma subdolum]RMA78489.1 phenylalanyl-tRNA synthetase alpha subunit [Metamycoplasma subdolum]WPB50421.1 phenylalanine--tRNA ligase subunit alpha [Metamycoplasma subdolum]
MKFNLDEIKSLEDLKIAKNKFSQSEELLELKAKLKEVNFEEKAEIGRKIQALQKEAEDFFNQAKEKLEKEAINSSLSKEFVDVAMPMSFEGSLHPVEIVCSRFRKWLTQNGYFELELGEIEEDLYNFEKLNIPKNHPARDMQDSLYLENNLLLRTHNTGVSARALEQYKNKAFSQFCIGKVYRNDEEDATHSHQFTQLDLVSVGKHSFGTLIYTLQSMLSYVLEEKVKIRLRPSYFPFTEPSVEVDVFFKNKWVEVLGAGMLHENVLKEAGYTNKMNGIAAGVGVERIVMIKYGIEDIREFYLNDQRFLRQFKN